MSSRANEASPVSSRASAASRGICTSMAAMLGLPAYSVRERRHQRAHESRASASAAHALCRGSRSAPLGCGGAGAQAPDPPPSVAGASPPATPSRSGSRRPTGRPSSHASARSHSAPRRAPVRRSPSTARRRIRRWTASATRSPASSALVINRMPDAARAALLRELFARDDTSLGVSYLRLSIGASDLSPASFTYDEVPAGQTDPTLASFTIDAETARPHPACSRRSSRSTRTSRCSGRPWTAPRWMKDNGSYVGGSLLPQYYQAYANYFVKYIQAMKAEGITIAAITPQNEPLNPNNEPSLVMTAAQQAKFIKCCLGPALRAAGLTTKILVYDHNADHPGVCDRRSSTIRRRRRSSTARRSISTTERWTRCRRSTTAHPGPQPLLHRAVHGDRTAASPATCAGTSATSSSARRPTGAAPRSSGTSPTTRSSARTRRAAARPASARVTIDSATSAVTRNVGYYILGHASRFVRPGSVRVASTLSGATSDDGAPQGRVSHTGGTLRARRR